MRVLVIGGSGLIGSHVVAQLAALALALGACGHQPAAPSATRSEPRHATAASGLQAIDVYGTDRLDVAWVKAHLGHQLERLVTVEDQQVRELLRAEIIAAILAAHRELGWVELSIFGAFHPGGIQKYLTIDVVEKADMASRLGFARRPAATRVGDPAGLIAAWNEYEVMFLEMMQRNDIPPGRVACPAFHCIAGYDHAKLAPYGERFSRAVPLNEARLIEVLQTDHDDDARGAAAFLLAHIRDGKKLVTLMLLALDDPGDLTRNNAMRVLFDVAALHPELDIPVDPVLRALNGPTTSDRNKAALVLQALVARPGNQTLHRRIIQQAGPTLIRLLALEQPNNHDPAYAILQQLSGRDLGEHDIAAWRAWLSAQR